MENSAPVLLTADVLKQRIVLSRGLLDILDEAELDASLAHELKWLFLIVRDMTMFSPAGLLAYTGFHQEEEKCVTIGLSRRFSNT